MDMKLKIALYWAKRIILPGVLGASVGWALSHGHEEWVDVICAFSDAILVDVQECK